MDVTSDGGLLYVTRGKFCNDVLVINTASFEIIKQIPVGKYPDHIIINLNETEAYVFGGHYQDFSVYVIDLEINEVTENIELDGQLSSAILSPDGKMLYVANSIGVQYLDTELHNITKTIEMDGEWYRRIAVHLDGTRFYISYMVDEDGHWPSVHVFDTRTGERIGVIENFTKKPFPDGGISDIEISPNGEFLYVTDNGDKLLRIIDSSTNKVIHVLDMQLGEYTVSGPDEMCFSPDGDLAYLMYCGAVPIDSPGPDSPSVITVIDASTHQKIRVITLDEWAGAGMMVFAP